MPDLLLSQLQELDPSTHMELVGKLSTDTIVPLCPEVMKVGEGIEAETGVDAEETAKETEGTELVTVLGGSGGTEGRFSFEFLREEDASGPG